MEKSLYNQVGEVKGAASENEDSFSFQFTPQNENLKRTRGALFTLVTISGKVDNRYEKAKNIYHLFQSSYYAKASGSILHGLSDTLEHLVKTTLSREEEAGIKVSVIAAVFWGTVVYLSKHGQGAVYVARAEKVKKLEFAKVASGVLEDQDTVCLATESFVENVETEELAEVLTMEKFEETLETLDKKITNVSAAVCDVIRLSVNAPKEVPEAIAIGEVDEKGEVEVPEPEAVSEIAAEEAKVVETEEQKEEEKVEETKEELVEAKEPEIAPNPDPFEKPIEKKTNPIIPLLLSVRGFASPILAKIAKPWKKPAEGEHFDPIAIRRARIIQVVIAILIVFFLSIIFGVFSKGADEKNAEINTVISGIEANLNEAASIKVLDPTRALALIEKAQDSINDAKKQDSGNQKLSELAERSSDLKAEITKTTVVEDLKTHFDFDNLNKDSRVSGVALLGDDLLVVDSSKGSLYSGSTKDQSVSQISDGVSSPKTIVSYPAGFYLTNDNNVSKIDSSLKVTNAQGSTNWGKIVDSATFENNLYLLDPVQNEIWRYLSTSSGLGSGRAYIAGEKPDMSNAVSIAIDDIVWVANKNGIIYKFAAGKRQEDYTISQLADPIGELSDMYTSQSTSNHYFLDKGKARIIVADKKTGVYQEAFANDKLHDADSLVVDEANRVVYFTAGNKLYQFNLP